jgi:hypothetical protein
VKWLTRNEAFPLLILLSLPLLQDS